MPTNQNTAEPQKPGLRWFQFRLRTLLLMVTIAAVICPISVRYVREREQIRADALEQVKKIAAAISFGSGKFHREK
jgi:hypothetical protein